MDDREFVDFLAAAWERRDWTTGVEEDADGAYMITGDRESGERGLMLVFPDSDATVAGQPVQRLAGICDAKNVDLGVVATRGAVSDDAERIADANDVHLVDADTLAETVEAEGFEDLLEKYETGDGSSFLDAIPTPNGLPSVLQSPAPVPVPARSLTALLVLVGVLAVALAGLQSVGLLALDGGALPVDGFGFGSGSDDFAVTATSLDGATEAGIGVAWNAQAEGAELDVNGTHYRAPEGEKFVVVTMSVTNDRPASSRFAADRLAFAANGTTQGPHTLANASNQLPERLQLGPDESRTTWVAFTVDDSAESGTLLALHRENAPPVRFERNSSLTWQPTGP